ncbi:MAG TPA: PAS domain S-box protein, partial [Caulobacter sp.]|nr:PAS domain S-box protein [Caulobacter sp.]
MSEASSREGPEGISAAEWRQIVQSAADTAIISTDRDGLITSWNAGAEKILGWTEAEMLGQTLDRLFPEESQGDKPLRQEMADAIAHGRGGGEEGWRMRADGSRLWAAGELTPIRGPAGEVVGFVKVLRDRTAQRAAEQAAAEERHALQVLNRAGSALAQRLDLQTLVQIITDAGVELTGAQFGAFFYNLKNEQGESYTLYTLSGAPAEAFSSFPMPRNTDIFAPTFNGEGIVRSDDITQDPRYGRNAPRRGMPEGHLPVRSYLAVPVISASQDVLGGLFFGHEQTGVFNDRSERGLEGLAAEAAVAIDNAALVQEVQRELFERRRAEDALREFNATLERQVLERTEQLREQEQSLRQAQKMEAVGQLTGGVAHDFNNLLQVIIGNLDILQRNLPEESGRLRRAAGQAMNGARRAAALTQRLLAFSRRQPLDPRPVNVNTLVTGLSELLQRTLGETISVETVEAAGLWQVEADPNELESAILNLALNARDAMPEGGKLTVETANTLIDEAYAQTYAEVAPGQYVCILVSDTGCGMEEATLARAFEPFFTTKPVGSGTGLGLSQVYGFVKQSGGNVRIYSEPGEGATVKLYLPRHRGKPAALDAEVPSGAAAESGETVLVVEDEPGVRALSVSLMEEL